MKPGCMVACTALSLALACVPQSPASELSEPGRDSLSVARSSLHEEEANLGNNRCPVGLVGKDSIGNPLTLDGESGPGTLQSTRCLERRNNLKMLVQINRKCAADKAFQDCGLPGPYALGNIQKAIADWEVTHGMRRGEWQVVAIVHGSGFPLMLKDSSKRERFGDRRPAIPG